jgi:hypothetical protein
MRQLLTDSLGLLSTSWDQFDSLCQRLDPSSNAGFLHLPKIIESFSNLPSLSSTISKDLHMVLSISQLCLSLASDSLFQAGSTISAALQKIISTNLSYIESFRRFLDHRKQQEDRSSIAHDIRFLSDLTSYLLTSNPRYVNQDLTSTRLKKLYQISSYQQGKLRSRHFQQGMQEVIHASEILSDQAGDTCEAIVRNMQIYSSTASPEHESPSILTSYGIMISTWIKFRRACLRYLDQELHHRFSNSSSKSNSTDKENSGLDQLRSYLEQEELLEDFRAYIDSFDSRFISSSSSAATVVEDRYELGRQVLELLGFPIPIENIDEIILRQLFIEITILLSSKRPNTSTTTAELEPVRATARAKPTSAVKAATARSLIDDVNSLIHEQRIQQIIKYLDHLNSKAQSKRKIVATLLVFSRQLKSLKRLPSSTSSSRATTTTAAEMELAPVEAKMSVEEIKERTLTIQRLLLRELSQEPSTIESQHAERVAALRSALAAKDDDGAGVIIEDADQKIAIMLDNVSAMEDSLLQANQDAMRLIRQVFTMVWS